MNAHAAETFRPVQLVSTEMLEAFWPTIEPLLQASIDRYGAKEMSIYDLASLVRDGKIQLIVVTNDQTGLAPYMKVELVLAVEVVLYPQLPALNIVAIGGRNLKRHKKRFWDMFKGWAYMNGARAIEASVGPAMQRVIQKWDFEPAYVLMRCRLDGDDK